MLGAHQTVPDKDKYYFRCVILHTRSDLEYLIIENNLELDACDFS